MCKLILALGISGLLLVGPAAAELVTFNTTGTTGSFGGGDTTLAGAILDPGLEASTLVFGPGLPTGNDVADSFSTHGWGATAALSFADDDYLSWTIDAKAGNAVNLSDISFNYNAQQNADVDWALFSSETGLASFSDAIATGNVLGTDIPFGNSTKSVSVDLTGVAALQGVEDSIEFRLVLANGINAFSRSGVRDSGSAPGLSIDGTVFAAVPEPSSLLLLGSFSLFFLGKRHRVRG